MTEISATYLDSMGSDLTVVNAARVSFQKKSDTFDNIGDTKLIKYLAKHKHMSPFGHCFATFHVKAPVFVARQLVKHKFLRINEVSRRYVDSDPQFYYPDVWRGRSADKKQGSDGEAKSQYFPNVYAQEVTEKALGDYRKMLQQGVAPEQARMILPQNMITEWYWSGSLDAFTDMLILRLPEDTQQESRIVAAHIARSLVNHFPVSVHELLVHDLPVYGHTINGILEGAA